MSPIILRFFVISMVLWASSPLNLHHDQIYLNVNPMLESSYMEKCFVQFYTFGQVINYSSIRTPFSISTGFNEDDNDNFFYLNYNQIFKIRGAIQCYSLIVIVEKCDILNDTSVALWRSVTFPAVYILPIWLTLLVSVDCISSWHKTDTYEFDVAKSIINSYQFTYQHNLGMSLLITFQKSQLTHSPLLTYEFALASVKPKFDGNFLNIYNHKQSHYKCKAVPAHCFLQAMKNYEEATQSGKKIIWMFANSKDSVVTVQTTLWTRSVESPFSRSIDTLTTLERAVNKFMTLQTNFSQLESNKSKSWLPLKGPLIKTFVASKFYINKLESIAVELYPVGSSPPFKFITSYNIIIKTGPLYIFASPLQPLVWIFILCATIFLSVLVTLASVISIRYKRNAPAPKETQNILSEFMLNWLRVSASLWEQAGLEIILSGISGRSVQIVAARLITLWFFLQIILSNAYKGFLKSDFTLQRKYTSNWSTIPELLDFELRAIERCRSEKEVKDFLLKIKPTFKYIHGNKQTWQVRPWVQGISFIKELENGKPPWDDDLDRILIKRYTDLQFQTKSICLKHLEGHLSGLADESYSKKTAFIFQKNQFGSIWPIFEEIMKRSKVAKYSHNMDTKDNFLGRPQMYALPSGLHTYGKHVRNQMNILLTSGIYWFWEKWDTIQSERIRTNSRNRWSQNYKALTVVKKLSFEHSDIAIVFYGFVAFVTGCFLTFSCEIIYSLRADIYEVVCFQAMALLYFLLYGLIQSVLNFQKKSSINCKRIPKPCN